MSAGRPALDVVVGGAIGRDTCVFLRGVDVDFSSAANLAAPAAIVRQLLAAKPDQVVVVGMGSRGCGLGTRAGWRVFDPVPLPDPVVDTSGAGDGPAVGRLAGHYLDGYAGVTR